MSAPLGRFNGGVGGDSAGVGLVGGGSVWPFVGGLGPSGGGEGQN